MKDLEQLVNTYKMPTEVKELLHKHPPLIICGVTGAGKDTIARHLMQSGNYAHVVSHTSRIPRPHRDGHEVDGVDYWFIDNAKATEMLHGGEFIEVEFVHGKDTLYGTSTEAYQRVVDNGKQPLLEIDIKGVQYLQSEVPGLSAIFLVPPDFETWQRRFRGRGEMSDDEIRLRLKSAVAEFETFLGSDNFTPVINREVIETARSIEDGSYKDEASIKQGRVAVEELLRETQALLATS